MAFKRNLARTFSSTHQSHRPNLLVSGCSYVWNNSQEHLVTWPYYLRDLAGYNQVFDCSQSAGGNAHVFNSIVYELETNAELTAENTDVVVMWAGMERTDIMADESLVQQWYHMDHITFGQGRWASLNVWPDATWARDRNSTINQFLKTYRVLIDNRAQILESCLRILALHGYLTQKGFNTVFTTSHPIQHYLKLLNDPVSDQVTKILADLENLDSYTSRAGDRISRSDRHPTPNSHLGWTRDVLMPFLTGQFITVK